MNEPYTYENPVSEMTENELFLMRTHGKHPADRVAAAAEIRRREQATTPADRALAIAQGEAECREQAGPTPGRWQIGNNEALVVAVGPEPCIVADCSTDCAISTERAKANAALIARAPELAAENERLRGLLAQMTDIIDHLLSQNTDNLMRAGIEQSETLTPANLAAIEAAKEATNAK